MFLVLTYFTAKLLCFEMLLVFKRNYVCLISQKLYLYRLTHKEWPLEHLPLIIVLNFLKFGIKIS